MLLEWAGMAFPYVVFEACHPNERFFFTDFLVSQKC